MCVCVCVCVCRGRGLAGGGGVRFIQLLKNTVDLSRAFVMYSTQLTTENAQGCTRVEGGGSEVGLEGGGSVCRAPGEKYCGFEWCFRNV